MSQSMDQSEEDSALLDSAHEAQKDSRRWLVLFLFSLTAIMQDIIWNTWNPIDRTASIVYGWSDDLIDLLSNYGYIFYIIAFLPVLLLLKRCLRKALCLSAFLMTMGTVWRALYLQDPNVNQKTFTVSCHICSILNGIANIVVGSAPLSIAAIWFPAGQRVTATAIATVFTGMSSGMSFVLSNLIVRPLDSLLPNKTMPSPDDITPELINDLISDLRFYMFSNAIPAGFLFVLILLFLPSGPEVPPSRSTGHERLAFFASFKMILRKRNSLFLLVATSLSQGVLFAWTAKQVTIFMNLCVESVCLQRRWIHALGVYTALATAVVTVILAQIADRTRAKVKRMILIMFVLAFFAFVLLSMITLKVLNLGSIFFLKCSITFLVIIGNSMVVSTMPLILEMAIESTFPVSEAVVGGCFSVFVNIVTIIMLSLFNIPNIGIRWLQWLLPISAALSSFLISFHTVDYKRLSIENTEASDDDTRE